MSSLEGVEPGLQRGELANGFRAAGAGVLVMPQPGMQIDRQRPRRLICGVHLPGTIGPEQCVLRVLRRESAGGAEGGFPLAAPLDALAAQGIFADDGLVGGRRDEVARTQRLELSQEVGDVRQLLLFRRRRLLNIEAICLQQTIVLN